MADPTAQVAVGITGDHFAFLQRLAADGVSWDITTEHFYAGHGDTIIRQQFSDVFGQLSRFGATILLTEFNQVDGSLLSAAEEASTLVTMMSTINDLAPAYDVFGGYIYELADEPPLVGGEAHYGLANETGNLNPAGLAVQRYLDDPGGLPPSTVPTHAIPVGEIPGEVFRLYETTLGREPDAAGFNFWIGQMNNGMSLQTVEGHLVASPEFQATNTGKLDDSQFVTQLCDQALHRAPEPAELNYWINRWPAARRAMPSRWRSRRVQRRRRRTSRYSKHSSRHWALLNEEGGRSPLDLRTRSGRRRVASYA